MPTHARPVSVALCAKGEPPPSCPENPGSEEEKALPQGSLSPSLPALPQAAVLEFGVSSLGGDTTSTFVLSWGTGPGARVASTRPLPPLPVTTAQEQSSLSPRARSVL